LAVLVALVLLQALQAQALYMLEAVAVRVALQEAQADQVVAVMVRLVAQVAQMVLLTWVAVAEDMLIQEDQV
jgi:hypothetical protein